MGGRIFKLQSKIESKVELNPFEAKHYDTMLNILSLGIYSSFINRATNKIIFGENESILDLGSGTGRFSCLFHRKAKIQSYVGIDLSEIMIRQAQRKCKRYKDTEFIHGDIRKELPLKIGFDKVFISFVLHGFMQEERIEIIKNAYNALKKGGQFIILDYAEKEVEKAPFFVKSLIRKMECPLAEKFMKINLKKVLREIHFETFTEYFFLGGYIRVEIATK